ncbi:MAG: aminotransferase class IV [Verrucomicrobiota bacterium]
MNDLAQSYVWNGDGFVPCGGIPSSDRGFRYGMALFESLAIRQGKVEFIEAHLERIRTACQRCGWAVDPAVLAKAADWFRQVPGPAFARIYITAGDGGPSDPVSAPRVFVFAEPRAVNPAAAYRLAINPEPFAEVHPGLKTANYWPRLERLNWAKSQGCDEALLVNPKGELISACMANLFVKVNGRWATPPQSSGARPGVVREWALRRCLVIERSIRLEEVREATECLLTSSWLGVVPVASINSRRLEMGFGEKLSAEFGAGPSQL